ncbi:CTLH/CRA C-terminal to lish motif domain-containing protein [Scheffersomyces xylosifermentans]|uniref:CTLH/CRA C-terminal to lish motif domain-containing protein n=1 Tax=Scheffersomyces xylosifermentans TaxID=1304137 RepID=UPI00315D2E4F
MSEPSLNFHIQTHSTQFRIPTELIKKNFKAIQKLIEKQKKQLTDDIAKIKKNSKIPTAMKLEMVRKLIKSFESFQKKLKLAVAKDEELQSRLLARMEHLALLNNYCLAQERPVSSNKEDADEKEPSAAKEDNDKYLDLRNPNLITWYRDQTNLLIIDYLIKSNTRTDHNIGILLLKNLAESNPKYRKLIDFDLFESFNKVYLSIMEDHDLTLVIAWFNENRNFLKKANSNLEFEINYCKFLTLIDNGDVNEAIKFSSLNLSSYGNINNYKSSDLPNYEHNFNRLKEIGGLLVYMAINEKNKAKTENIAFSSNVLINSPRFHEYEKLLSNERWDSLSQCFIENFTKLYGISRNYPIFIYLSAGLSSLKTKSCYHNTENTIFRDASSLSVSGENIYKKDLAVLTDKKYRGPNQYYKLLNKINNCPVCSPELYRLSRNLPYAQLITSIFNNPFKLPNGNIYPFDKLLNPSEKYLSEKNTLLRMGKIKDPLTREIFLIDNCIRVYPA